MKDVYNSMSLDSVAAALCKVLGIDPPRSAAEANPILSNIGSAKKLVMYNPDAIGLEVFQKYTALFAPVLAKTTLALPLSCVMPSVTPVCFGTMYTGVQPEVHGIRRYERPVITVDSLYDAAIRAGLRCAIVSEPDCSLADIFLGRDMDYYRVEGGLDAINAKGLELIDKYDVLTLYNGNFDSTMHKNGPDAPASVEALRQNVETFARVWEACPEGTLVGFAPDHGCHLIDGECGSHGLDMPSDINIVHFYGIK